MDAMKYCCQEHGHTFHDDCVSCEIANDFKRLVARNKELSDEVDTYRHAEAALLTAFAGVRQSINVVVAALTTAGQQLELVEAQVRADMADHIRGGENARH